MFIQDLNTKKIKRYNPKPGDMLLLHKGQGTISYGLNPVSNKNPKIGSYKIWRYIQFELDKNNGNCQGDAECVSNFNIASEFAAFFEGHAFSFNSNGQLVASYKGCAEILTDSIA